MLPRIITTLLTLAALLWPVHAGATDRLVLLRRVTIDLSAGHQKIYLPTSRGRINALRIKAVSHSLTLTSVKVLYRNRLRHHERRRIVLFPGERTREINPATTPYPVDAVAFTYTAVPAARAVIEIYARQTTADATRRTWPWSGEGSTRRSGKTARRPSTLPDNAAPPPAEMTVDGNVRASRSIASTAPLACVTENACTPVRVFFGTNRNREDLPERVAFSWKDSGSLALGSAVVTVPRKVQRASGAILRPTWWDRYVLRVPAAGDPARHFVIVPNLLEIYSDDASFLSAVARHREQAGAYKDHAFVYVHGYRVDFDYGLYRTAQMAYDLGTARPDDGVVEPFGTAFLYSWPSAGQLKDYAYDQEAARLSVAHLKAFLELIVKRTGVKHVHLVAHSMGNVPLLNAMNDMALEGAAGARVSQVILAAPDMGALEFKTLAADIKARASGFTLYASSSDVAMEASRKVHKNEPRAGDVVAGLPVVTQGVDTIDISAITTCYFCFGHDEYVEQPELLNDIAALLQRGTRPPDTRTQAFRPQTEGDLPFWRYQP